MKLTALALAFAALLAAGAQAAGGRGAAKPRVWIVGSSPVGVAVSGFKAHDRIALSVVASGTKFQKTVRATVAGRAQAEWSGTINVDACHVVVVTAVAKSGLRARYASPKGMDCNPVQPIEK